MQATLWFLDGGCLPKIRTKWAQSQGISTTTLNVLLATSSRAPEPLPHPSSSLCERVDCLLGRWLLQIRIRTEFSVRSLSYRKESFKEDLKGHIENAKGVVQEATAQCLIEARLNRYRRD
jgi:hypothetical protein